MIHVTCKRTKTAEEDLSYVVQKFLRAEVIDTNVIRYTTDSHTHTVSTDKRHLQMWPTRQNREFYNRDADAILLVYL